MTTRADLVARAIAAQQRAYAPYSKFSVGAAVLVHDSPCAWHGDLVRAIIGMLEHRAATPEQAARIAALRARCDEWMNATATGTPATADAIGALAALSARNDRGALGAAQAAFASTTDRAARAAILDVLCTWPTWRMACVLPGLATEPWAQLRAADRDGVRLALLLGDDELATGRVTVREMQGDAPQETIPQEGLAGALAERLGRKA